MGSSSKYSSSRINKQQSALLFCVFHVLPLGLGYLASSLLKEILQGEETD
jgi:hypothetical protein